MITTTLAEIRAAGPCSDGFAKIREHLGVSPSEAKGHKVPFPVALLLETNDLDDTLWVLDNCINSRLCRLFAADCAERALHLFEDKMPGDDRPRKAIEVARDANADHAARAAARDAARDAARAAAWAAARDAARAAAGDAAGDAARDAAWAAARAAAGDAAGDAARDAARAAQIERLKQYLEHGEAAKDMPWPQKRYGSDEVGQ